MTNPISSASSPWTVTTSSAASSRPIGSALSLLSDNDWKVISAATGQNLTADNYLPAGAPADEAPVLPLIAFTMANDRRSGVIPAGTDVTAAYFQERIQSGQPDDFNAELARAVAYISSSAATHSQHSTQANTLDLLA